MDPRAALLTLACALAPPASGAQVDAALERGVLELDGARFFVEREVRREEDRAVPHGRWRRWALVEGEGPPAVDKVPPLAEGSWSDGRLEGEWTWRRAGGKPLMAGTFDAGRRTGDWRFFHADGEPAATGEFAHGLRHGPWNDTLAGGEPDAARAGRYDQQRVVWPASRNPRLRAETRRNLRHGAALAFWRDGQSPMLMGQYVEGLPDAWWSFWLIDGTLETELLTGWYREGVWLAEERRPGPRDEWDLSFEERFQLRCELARLPAKLAAPRSYGRGVSMRQRTELRQKLARYTGGEAELLGELASAGRPLVADVLQRLIELDLADPADLERGGLLSQLLREICGGRGFEWQAAHAPAEQEANRRALARWLSWWELVLEDDGWWKRLAEGLLGDDANLLCWELLTGHDGALPVSTRRPRPAPTPVAQRPSDAAPVPPAAQETHLALRAALMWLLEHQAEDGRWAARDFAKRCGVEGPAACGGPGRTQHDVGVTGLALLALTGGGPLTGLAGVEEAVNRGLDWLVAQQRHGAGPEQGLIATVGSWAAVYDHAIAALALAEGYRSTNRAELLEAVAPAMALILRAQRPGSGWRYSLVPDGDADSSITTWMVLALQAAEEVGRRIDPAAFMGARALFDALTDPDTARIGYDRAGSASARVPDVNTHYPTDRTETLTAAGLHGRLRMGQDPRTEALLTKHADLMLRALPEWSAEGLTNDLYYWYHGTLALFHLAPHSPLHWEAWSAATKLALQPNQRRDGHLRGSWDPSGPWGSSGGRVYATALGALALEAILRDSSR